MLGRYTIRGLGRRIRPPAAALQLVNGISQRPRPELLQRHQPGTEYVRRFFRATNSRWNDDKEKEQSPKEKEMLPEQKATEATAAAEQQDASNEEPPEKESTKEKLAANKEEKQEKEDEMNGQPETPGSDAPSPAATTTAPEFTSPELAADAAKQKEGLNSDDIPAIQNPLHHNNPDMERTYPEDFDSPEEFEKNMVPLPPLDTSDNSVPAPPYLQEIADEIVHLTMLEMNELVNRIADHYGFHEADLSPDGDADADDEEDDEGGSAPVEEKTTFDIKLVGFDEKAKIKVIKEIRSIAGLGLKEAKELVESAPKVVLKDTKKETAEEIKAKLEEIGAQVEIV